MRHRVRGAGNSKTVLNPVLDLSLAFIRMRVAGFVLMLFCVHLGQLVFAEMVDDTRAVCITEHIDRSSNTIPGRTRGLRDVIEMNAPPSVRGGRIHHASSRSTKK